MDSINLNNFKPAFTGVLLFLGIDQEGADRKLRFVSYLREDYMEKGLFVYLKGDKVQSVEFSSNKYGTVKWINGHGLLDAHRWETEEDLENISYLSKHYQSPLENGIVEPNRAWSDIIPDVLESLIDKDFSKIIYSIVSQDNFISNLLWDQIIGAQVKLTQEFIDKIPEPHGINYINNNEVYNSEIDISSANRRDFISSINYIKKDGSYVKKKSFSSRNGLLRIGFLSKHHIKRFMNYVRAMLTKLKLLNF
jgi:hypothetical protein